MFDVGILALIGLNICGARLSIMPFLMTGDISIPEHFIFLYLDSLLFQVL